jgi:hypothetical protein
VTLGAQTSRAGVSELRHDGGVTGDVVAVNRSGEHTFSKPNRETIRLLVGLGVEDDAHAGALVQHLSRVARDPSKPNLRQVHLVHAELFEELAGQGFTVLPGDIGENVTTRGVDLLGLPTGTRLRLGTEAVVEVTGLRNPCLQLDTFQNGLMKATLDRAEDGSPIRKAGIMGVVLEGGEVRPGDPIGVEVPDGPHMPLQPV